MADVVVGAKLQLEGGQESINTVKNFKKELRDAQQEVVVLSEKFGATSKEASAAAQKAAELKDAIGDARSLVDAFNPDTKFKAFGASINTVVGGFTALQGVLGLVGAESEETQKALLKVQSALAISQGFAQLQEGLQTFKNLSAVIQQTTLFQKANAAATNLASLAMRAFGVSANTASTGFQVLKGAIIATGIGALVIGLAAAADALGFFKDKTDDAADAQKKLQQQLDDTNDSLNAQKSFLDREQKLEVANAKARGASAKEIFEIENKYRVLTYQAESDRLDKIDVTNEVERAKIISHLKDLNTDGKVARINYHIEQAKIDKEAADKADKVAEDLRKKRLEQAAKDAETRANNFAANPNGGKVALPKTVEQLQREAEIQTLHEKHTEDELYYAQSADLDALYTVRKKKNADDRKATDQAELDFKLTVLNASTDALGSLSALVGQQTAAGKILALTQIAAGTAVGFIQALDIAQKSAKATGPAAVFAFPIFYATQLAAVLGAAAKAKSALSGGSTSAGTSTTGASVSAPLTPPKPVQSTTALDQNSLNALGSATTRAFVVESDVANNRERIARLNRAARIGG